MWIKRILLVVTLSLVATESPPPFYDNVSEYDAETKPLVDPIDGLSYRLPNNTRPLTYDIWISTDIHRGDFDFDGRVNILIEVVQNTVDIVLHYRQMNVQTVNLFFADNTVLEPNVAFVQNETLEFLVIRPSLTLIQGQRVIVQVFYNGVIREDSSGFYRSSYFDPETNERVWLATTQFQATDARHAFPCYDEPGIRSLFKVSIRHDESYIALSNMPEVSRIPVAGTSYIVTSFDQTLSMQSYLVAFTVSNFIFIEDNSAVPPQKIYGKRHSIENGEGELALDAAVVLMAGFEEYLGIPYSFPKMDQFACPNFRFAAMENWGLAIYGEAFLLFDPAIDRTRDRENVVVVVSHEFAHQWFGNLVSPAWWSYLWVNEGFAILYEFYLTHWVYPEGRYMDNFYFNYKGSSLEQDANPNARAMTHYVENPDRILGLFDFVAYDKAGSVFFMMQNALSDSTLRKGLNNFLTARQYNSTTAEHLYEGLQIAANEDIRDNTPNIATIMSTWELQAGFPLVTVTRNGLQLTFEQERFFYGNETSESLWWVPINYVVGSNPIFSVTTPDFWFPQRSINIRSSEAPKPWTVNDWIIVNIQQGGYYRVNYDNALWNLIIHQLNGPDNAFEVIHLLNRAQLIDDSFHLARAERINFDIPMEIMNYLHLETDHLPWAFANRASILLNRWLTGTPVYIYYQRFIRRNTAALYNKLGVNIIDNELRVDRYARAIAIDLACQAGAERCLAETARELENMILSGNPLAADVEQTTYCNGVRRANIATVEAMQNMLMQSRRQRQRNFIVAGLGCVENPEILHSHLFLALRPGTGLSTAERSNILLSPLNHGESSLRVMMEFIRFNYGGINLINPNQVSILCNNIAARVASESVFTEFNALLSHLVVNGALLENAANNFRTSARSIIEWQSRHLIDFIQFFGRHPIEAAEF